MMITAACLLMSRVLSSCKETEIPSMTGGYDRVLSAMGRRCGPRGCGAVRTGATYSVCAHEHVHVWGW
jgi:hypothetical protein